MLIFKAFYYFGSLLSPLLTLKAGDMRRLNIRNVGSIAELGAAGH